MSAENSITQTPATVTHDAAEAERRQPAFGIPDDLATRYEIRAIEGRNEADHRIGLFLSGEKNAPSLEISDDKIVAGRSDPTTAKDLVSLAQHNGWSGITVEGDEQFRRMVWQSASLAGLEVQGYEPTFEEREVVERLRREERERHDAERLRSENKNERNAEEEHVVEVAEMVMDAASASPAMALASDLATADDPSSGERATAPKQEESLDAAAAILKRKSALVHELTEVLREDPALASESVSHFVMKQGAAQSVLAGAGASQELLAARQLMTESLVAEVSRDETNLTKTVGEYLRDQPFEIDELTLSRGLRVPDAKSARDELVAEVLQERRAFSEFRANKANDKAVLPESDRLAELFLNGSQAERAAEPKLANALNAEEEMRRHLEAAFEGNSHRIETVTLEGRQMISDVLRRGLDVSVREPTPVRQIEPAHTPPQMER